MALSSPASRTSQRPIPAIQGRDPIGVVAQAVTGRRDGINIGCGQAAAHERCGYRRHRFGQRCSTRDTAGLASGVLTCSGEHILRRQTTKLGEPARRLRTNTLQDPDCPFVAANQLNHTRLVQRVHSDRSEPDGVICQNL